MKRTRARCTRNIPWGVKKKKKITKIWFFIIAIIYARLKKIQSATPLYKNYNAYFFFFLMNSPEISFGRKMRVLSVFFFLNPLEVHISFLKYHYFMYDDLNISFGAHPFCLRNSISAHSQMYKILPKPTLSISV